MVFKTKPLYRKIFKQISFLRFYTNLRWRVNIKRRQHTCYRFLKGTKPLNLNLRRCKDIYFFYIFNCLNTFYVIVMLIELIFNIKEKVYMLLFKNYVAELGIGILLLN